MGWNLGDVFDAVGAALPADAPALMHGDRLLSWGEMSRRSNSLARALIDRGARPDDKIALYMRNCPEYMETAVAAFKARLVHVNVNFRYVDQELAHILLDSDARWVVFDAEFTERVEKLVPQCPEIAGWIQVSGEPASFAQSYDRLSEAGDVDPLEIVRSPDDLLFIYTGGTTGAPKAVMWRHEDVWGALGAGANAPANRGGAPVDLAEHVRNVAAYGPGPRQIAACPLMHGTGLLTCITTLSGGGSIITVPGAGFEPDSLLDAVERLRANSIVIVGDAFAKPLLESLDRRPGERELGSLKVILSSGVMWSREVKQRLLEHLPGVAMVDLFGSSEAIGFGRSVTTRAGGGETARFRIGESCKVFTEGLREVKPGSGERGFIARSGPIPLGYYKDPQKTASVFKTIDGVRYSIPGDWCTVDADGTLNLLGRGSACINTGGEKVFPEEVEEVLKKHPDVRDALVFGMPDERFGQAVTAVVEPAGAVGPGEADLRQHVRGALAGYKVPRSIHLVPQVFRAPNGKADYKAAAAFVSDLVSGR